MRPMVEKLRFAMLVVKNVVFPLHVGILAKRKSLATSVTAKEMG